MIFDRFCKFVEKIEETETRAYLTSALRRSAIFVLDKDEIVAEEENVKHDKDERIRRMFLPFERIWVETEYYGCLISAIEPGAMECDERYPKNTFSDFSGAINGRGLEVYSFGDCAEGCSLPGSSFFVCGVIEPYESSNESLGGINFRLLPARVSHVNRNGVGAWYPHTHYFKPGNTEDEEFLSSYMWLPMDALQLINAPSKWIVKREHVTARPVQKGKIPRSDQRPRYIVVSDKEIERVIRDPNPANAGTVRPHRRRAHSHLLKSERFTWKRGQRVFVKACWVGPETAEYGGERYSVCLDL